MSRLTRTGTGTAAMKRTTTALAALRGPAVRFLSRPGGNHVHRKRFGGREPQRESSPTRPAVAVNNTTGDIYVADRGNNRIEEFSSAGGFVRAWGYDVVQPAARTTNRTSTRSTKFGSGRPVASFSLIFKGEETAQIPYKATPRQVKGALNALPAIKGTAPAVARVRSPAAQATPRVPAPTLSPSYGSGTELGTRQQSQPPARDRT